jgi:hypothetical protein
MGRLVFHEHGEGDDVRSLQHLGQPILVPGLSSEPPHPPNVPLDYLAAGKQLNVPLDYLAAGKQLNAPLDVGQFNHVQRDAMVGGFAFQRTGEWIQGRTHWPGEPFKSICVIELSISVKLLIPGQATIGDNKRNKTYWDHDPDFKQSWSGLYVLRSSRACNQRCS